MANTNHPSDLDELSDDFPEEFFKLKVMPELMKSVEFGGGGPKALGVVLKIAAKLPSEDFDTKVTPFVVRLFSNPDRAIRVCLLDSLPLMIDRLAQKIVNDKIFPQMVSPVIPHDMLYTACANSSQVTGFTDMAPVVREQTLKSVLVIITKLSDRTINGELLKHLAKTANDEQPGIRTNTTICLGKIAKNLGTSTRSKVLIAAFTRSLRDPFVHARNAALMSLGATVEHFSDEDCAVRILPVVTPSLIDKEKMIRDQANRTMDIYLAKIRKAAANMPDTVLPPPQATDSQAPRMGTPQATESAGWTGWAISSFTNKLSSAAGDMQTNGAGAASPRPQSSSAGLVRPTTTSTASASNLHRQAVKSPTPDASRATSPNPSTVANAFLSPEIAQDEDAGDSWGDMGDMDEDGFVDAPSTNTTTKKKENATTAAYDESEPDFEGWLAAQAQKKSVSSKPLPKGLAKGGAAKKPLGKPAAAKPLVAKKLDLKPKETADDDDNWGDGW